LKLLNAILMHETDLERRISYRNDLMRANTNDILEGVKTSAERRGRNAEFERRKSTVSLKESEGPAAIRFQPGMTIQMEDVVEALAEDLQTPVHPACGRMSGFCWEAKKSKLGVKHRWYEVKDGVFSWYHPEERDKDINCAPNGSQHMSGVVEILGYSTAENIQALFNHCFVIHCSDGTKYQIGVRDKLTKEKWVVALNASMSKYAKERTAFT
jgi:hypothetical protein